MINIKGKCSLTTLGVKLVPASWFGDDKTNFMRITDKDRPNVCYVKETSFHNGVIPIAVLATAVGMKRHCSALGLGKTYEEAVVKAKRNLRKRVMEHTKREKPVITLGPLGYRVVTENGTAGYGPTLQDALTSLKQNLDLVDSLLEPKKERFPKPVGVLVEPPTEPKRWSFWDWFK